MAGGSLLSLAVTGAAQTAYDAVAERYDSNYAEERHVRENALLRHLMTRECDLWYARRGSTASAPRIIDLGCGTGLVPDLIPEYVEPGCYLGIDTSVRMLDAARDKWPALDFIRGDMAMLDFPPLDIRGGYFDFAVSTFAFGHSVLPYSAMGQMFRVLRRGGRLFVVTFSEGWVSPGFLSPAIPVKRYRARELASMAKFTGFYDVKVRAFGGGSLRRVRKNSLPYLLLTGTKL